MSFASRSWGLALKFIIIMQTLGEQCNTELNKIIEIDVIAPPIIPRIDELLRNRKIRCGNFS